MLRQEGQQSLTIDHRNLQMVIPGIGLMQIRLIKSAFNSNLQFPTVPPTHLVACHTSLHPPPIQC